MINNLLVIRFSALGDVAMTIPLLKALAIQYSELQITVLSRQQYASLFADMPSNIHFYGADLKGRHCGITGLNRLLKDINYTHFDAVADLHNVLRTIYLDCRFRLTGKQVVALNKGRYAKWRLTRHFIKSHTKLPSVFNRQQDVFQRLGLNIIPIPITSQKQRQGIGIAPFAAHRGKQYPTQKMEQVVKLLSEQQPEPIYLFGATGHERDLLEIWSKKYNNTVNISGRYDLQKEVEFMSSLRCMLSMDSANMHLASLVGTRVVSIWGATHPDAGFLGYNQSEDDCIQRKLRCRPCSVFGNKTCRYNDYHCLTDITPQEIVNHILEA